MTDVAPGEDWSDPGVRQSTPLMLRAVVGDPRPARTMRILLRLLAAYPALTMIRAGTSSVHGDGVPSGPAALLLLLAGISLLVLAVGPLVPRSQRLTTVVSWVVPVGLVALPIMLMLTSLAVRG